MLTAVAIIPSAPVLVPQLAGAAADELVDARAAVLACAATLPGRWVGLGVAPADLRVGPDAAGTFAGYGVDVRVTLAPDSSGNAPLPLCALMTGWVRGIAAPTATAEVRAYAATRDTESALDIGRRLRAEIDEIADPVGVLVVADGAHTLTPAAPGGHDPASVDVQKALDDALATGDASALTALPAGVVGRVAFGVLAGLVERPRSAREHYRGAPYGVGYFAGTWQP